MKSRLRNPLFAIVTIIVLVLSLVNTATAFADDELPPAAPTEEPVLPPTEESVNETPDPEPTDEAASSVAEEVAEETPLSEEELTVAEVLEELPQGTEVVVLNEEGDVEPLATQAAAQIIISGDPMWCPTGVLPGGAGCTGSFANFNGPGELLDFLQVNSATYTGAGTIYVAHDYSSAGEGGSIVIDSADGYGLTDLTIQGGWDFVGNAMAVASTVNTDLQIYWGNNITLKDLIFDDSGGSWNVYVDTTGGILLDNVESSNNSGGAGAYLNTWSGTGDIILQDSRFRDNNNGGVETFSGGFVTLTDVYANHNDGTGAYLNAEDDVTVNGGTFNSNDGEGINAYSADGDINIAGADAQDNDDDGLNLYSEDESVSVSNGGFNYNGGYGVYVEAEENVTLSNVIASDNNYGGTRLDSNSGDVSVSNSAFVDNYESGAFGLEVYASDDASLITLTDVTSIWSDYSNLHVETYGDVQITNGVFDNSYDLTGMEVYADGYLTLMNVQANGNDEGGLYADIIGDLTINGGLFNNNYYYGIYLEESEGEVNLTDVEASGNEASGAYLDNSDDDGDVTINSSVFSYNDEYGLYVNSAGDVNLDGVTADGNDDENGAYIYNAYGSGSVLVSDSQFNSNHANDGLSIYSSGLVTLTDVIANFNSSNGAYIDNAGGSDNVTISSSSFNANQSVGFYVNTGGNLSLANVSAGANSGFGGYADVGGDITDSGTNSFNYNNPGGSDCFGGFEVNSVGGTATLDDCYDEDTNVWYLSGSAARNFNTITDALTDIDSGLFLMDDGILHIDSALTPYLEDASIDGSDIELGQITQVVGGGYSSTLIAGYLEFYDFGSGFSLSDLALSKYVEAWDNTGAVGLTNMNAAGLDSSASSGSGIDIHDHDGSITLNGVNASGIEDGSGIYLDNSSSSVFQPITVTNSTFNGNEYSGLQIYSNGVVTLADDDGSFNLDGDGAYIDNSFVPSNQGQDVNISGSNFGYNGYRGLYAYSYGDFTLNNVAANGNYYEGAYLETDGDTGNVMVQNSFFNYNTYEEGLEVYNNGEGNILVSNVTADGNYGTGAFLDNNYGSGGTGSITVSNSIFNYSYDGSNLEAYNDNNGDIQLSGVTASGAYNENTHLENDGDTGDITVLNSVFNYSQEDYGLEVYNYAEGNIFISGVTGNGNYSSGAYLENSWGSGGVGGVSVLNSAFNNTVDDDGLYIYNSDDGHVLVTNVTANANDGHGTHIENYGIGYTVTVDPSVFNYNGYEGLYIYSNGDVILDSVTANFNADNGANLETSGNASVCSSTFQMNLGYGLNASGVSGALTLNNVAFGGNVSGDYDYSGTATINNGIDCIPSSGAGGGSGSPSSVIIPVTGGEPITCDGSAPNVMIVLPNGDFVILPCPINEFAVVDVTPQEGLPGPLEDDLDFISALTALVIRENQPVDSLEEPMVVSFLIPEGVDPETLSILFWDGSEWVEVAGHVSEDGLHFEATTSFTGTFVLVMQ